MGLLLFFEPYEKIADFGRVLRDRHMTAGLLFMTKFLDPMENMADHVWEMPCNAQKMVDRTLYAKKRFIKKLWNFLQKDVTIALTRLIGCIGGNV